MHLCFYVGYESMAIVYDRSSLEVMDFGKTHSYGLRMYGPATTGLTVYSRSLRRWQFGSFDPKYA